MHSMKPVRSDLPPTSIFNDGNLQIRTFIASDASPLHSAVNASLPELSVWMSWCTGGYAMPDSESFISRCDSNFQNGVTFDFGVFDVASDTVLGAVAINGICHENKRGNIDYWVRSDATGRGIATLATRAAARYGFNELGLARIDMLSQPTNQASRRVAEKLGGCFEVIAHDRIRFRGAPRATAVYSLRREDIRD